jgi:DNA-binding NarL/FixJ family response regulator
MALMDGDEAAQLKALEIFERLGARPIIEILKRQMRAQGIRIPRGPRPATRENPLGLTAREMEVLSCVVKGLSNNAIGKKLSLSTRTVEHHIASILQKMGVQSRNEAVALALKEKLFTLG